MAKLFQEETPSSQEQHLRRLRRFPRFKPGDVHAGGYGTPGGIPAIPDSGVIPGGEAAGNQSADFTPGDVVDGEIRFNGGGEREGDGRGGVEGVGGDGKVICIEGEGVFLTGSRQR